MSVYTARIPNYTPVNAERSYSEAFERFMAELDLRAILVRALDRDLSHAAKAGEFA